MAKKNPEVALKERLVAAVTTQAVVDRTAYRSLDEAMRAAQSVDVSYNRVTQEFIFKRLALNLVQALQAVFPSFVVTQSEEDTKKFFLSKANARIFSTALKADVESASSVESTQKEILPENMRGHTVRTNLQSAAVLQSLVFQPASGALAAVAAQPAPVAGRERFDSGVSSGSSDSKPSPPMIRSQPKPKRRLPEAVPKKPGSDLPEAVSVFDNGDTAQRPVAKKHLVVVDESTTKNAAVQREAISDDSADSMFSYLSSLNRKVQEKSWDTQGVTFFSRHVPRHIQEMRDVYNDPRKLDQRI